MKTTDIQSLNRDITNERVSMPYPHLRVLNPNDAIALMLPELPEGDLPVLCDFNGTCRQIGSIRKSAIVINDLRKITGLKFFKSKDVAVDIKTSLDAVEVLM